MLERGLAQQLAAGFSDVMRRYRKGGVTAEVSSAAEGNL
jgi:hypothetical protein